MCLLLAQFSSFTAGKFDLVQNYELFPGNKLYELQDVNLDAF